MQIDLERSIFDNNMCDHYVLIVTPPQGIGLPLKFDAETWHLGVRGPVALNVWDGDLQHNRCKFIHYFSLRRSTPTSDCFASD